MSFGAKYSILIDLATSRGLFYHFSHFCLEHASAENGHLLSIYIVDVGLSYFSIFDYFSFLKTNLPKYP
jgi:hypothetical protein